MKLINKRILITRQRAQADEFASALIAEGAQPIFFPVIEIAPADDFSDFDRALKRLDQYDWLIFTSIHGVDSFFKRLEFLAIKKIPSHVRLIAVGSRTGKALSKYGCLPDYIPGEFIAEGILSGLNENIAWKRFLLPQSNLARKTLADEIRFAGGIVDQVTAYHTIKAQPDTAGLEALREGVDIITFTSPSTMKNFLDITRDHGLDPLHLVGDPLFACIGPVTRRAAEEAGFTNLVVANEYTTSGIIQMLGNLVPN